jgi:hypothetical protein
LKLKIGELLMIKQTLEPTSEFETIYVARPCSSKSIFEQILKQSVNAEKRRGEKQSNIFVEMFKNEFFAKSLFSHKANERTHGSSISTEHRKS